MKRQTTIAVAVVTLVVLLGWFMFSYRPKGSELAEARKKTQEAKAQEAPLRADLARLQALDRERPLREAELQRLVGLIPERDELAGFLIAADELRTRSGMRQISVNHAPPAASAVPGQPSVIGLSIQLEGGFFQLLDYLGRMERLRRLIVIDSIIVAPGAAASGTSGGGGSLTVTLTGRMFTTAPPAGTVTTTVVAATPTTVPVGVTTTVPGPPVSSTAPVVATTTTVGG